MSCRLKHLAVAAAIIGLATQVHAGYFPGSTDFEDTNANWTIPADGEITGDATVGSAARATYRPLGFSTTTRENVLLVDNDAATPIVCDINAGETMPASTIYADVLVKGYPLANDAAAPEYGNSDKLLVYTRVNAAGTDTNLCVLAKSSANSITNEAVLTSTHIGKDEWHRIIIEAVNDGTYKVYCDTFAQNAALGTYYPINALNSGDAVMSSVAFAGSGSVDDVILTDFIPEQPVHTITWPTSLASVSYTVDGVAGDALTAGDGQYQFQAAQGSAIVVTGNNGYVDLTANGTIGAGAATIALVEPAGIAKYTNGDGTEQNPYEIPCYEALVEMKDLVASNATARSAYYIQTADIDFEGKPAFAGIGEYQKVPTSGTPFTGTYDGQGHIIKNVTRAGGDTQGIFNQVGVGGVVENLVVSNMAVAAGTTGYGFAIVGNAGGGATLRNLTAAGTFASADNPSGHNIAGIVVRLCGGATSDVATTIDSCTNNATIYGAYTKMGGICAIVQQQTGFTAGKVVFTNCANNGNLVCKRTAAQCKFDTAKPDPVTGNAGIIGYTSANNVELTNCFGNGVITNSDGANTDKDGALIGWQYSGYTLKDNGGNSAPANKKMIAYYGNVANVTGFQYATIDDGVATTISGNPVANGTYLLEGNAAPVIELANGQTIAFDTSLSYTLTDTGITAASPLVALPSTSGNVTTYSTGYFPRTATAGQDGSAAHPFEIADLDDLQAFKATVEAQVNKDKYYVLTANIDMSSVAAWDGIGTRDDIPTAFTGTLDGAGFAINNLTLKAGKYSGFFDELRGTVKNLTINVAGFETTSAAEHGYAAFAGSTTGAVFENCVATGTIGTQAKPALHTCGGFVVRVTNPSTFVNCTNHIDIVCSLRDNPKIGGIAGLFMNGGALTNCYNDGDMTITLKKCEKDANGAGGLIGYAQGAAVTVHHCGNAGTIQSTDTTADGGTYDTHTGTIVGSVMSGGTVTVTGGTIAQADAASAGLRASTTGLDFATVDNNVATFVSTLAAGGTYKVMTDGATATFAFAEAGTIAFNTALFTPTYAITAAEGLDLTNETVGTVKTYTAAVAVTGFDDPEGNEITDQDVIDWLTAKGFDQEDINALGQNAAGTAKLNECYLLNCDITQDGAGGTLSITAITVGENVLVTVELDRTGSLGAINGTLKLNGTSALGTAFAELGSVTFSDDDFSDGDTTTATFSAGQNKFFKAVIE